MQLDRTRPEEECSRQAVGLQGVAEAGEEHTRTQVLRARVDSRREEDQEALESKEARKESKFLNSGRETNNAFYPCQLPRKCSNRRPESETCPATGRGAYQSGDRPCDRHRQGRNRPHVQ